MITQQQFDLLCDVFATLTSEGWQIPEWLAEWGVKLGYIKEIE